MKDVIGLGWDHPPWPAQLGLFFSFFNCCSIRLPSFFSHYSPLPFPPPPSIFIPPHPCIVFVPGSFIHVPWWSFPFFPLLSSSPLPLVTVSLFFYFHVSGSVLLMCVLCWLGSTYGEIIWYFSLIWLISLSIMPCSSIHAVMKGKSSFFLSAV